MKYEKALLDVINLYLNGESGDWAVAWSGGKDSTVVSSLVVRALLTVPEEKRKRHVYFVMSDTGMENPILEKYMENERR